MDGLMDGLILKVAFRCILGVLHGSMMTIMAGFTACRSNVSPQMRRRSEHTSLGISEGHLPIWGHGPYLGCSNLVVTCSSWLILAIVWKIWTYVDINSHIVI